jgi:hypothetical protein
VTEAGEAVMTASLLMRALDRIEERVRLNRLAPQPKAACGLEYAVRLPMDVTVPSEASVCGIERRWKPSG